MRMLPLIAVLALLPATSAHSAELVRFSPETKTQVGQQISARFSEPMTALGDIDAAVPFVIDCKYPGRAQWLGPTTWTLEFERALPPGARCSFRPSAGLKALSGATVKAAPQYVVETAGLTARLLNTDHPVNERGALGIAFNAPVDLASAVAAMRCEFKGRAPIPVRRASPALAEPLGRDWRVTGFSRPGSASMARAARRLMSPCSAPKRYRSTRKSRW